MYPRVRHKAFTLVELLVVAAIVGVLMGLLLPALQKVREATNRIRCQNNLKQLGIALHQYHNSRNHFPSGAQAKVWPKDPTVPQSSYRWSALVALMPYLEQSNLYQSMDLTSPMYGGPRQLYQMLPDHRQTVSQKIELLLCPSDRRTIVSEGFGPTNYSVCAGSGIRYGTAWETDGVFFVNSRTRMAQITDGTSQTILASESVLGAGGEAVTNPAQPLDAQTAYKYVGPGFGPFNPLQSVNEEHCQASSAWNYDRHRGYSWADGQYRSALYNHFYPPNYETPDCIGVTNFFPFAHPNDPTVNTPAGWKTARSRHPGGVNGLLGDGSVRFLDNDISLETWQALSTRAGGEAVGDFW